MCYTYEFKNVSICIGRDSIQKFNLKRCDKNIDNVDER